MRRQQNDTSDVLAVWDEAMSWLPYDGDDHRIRERASEARACAKELRDAAVEFYAGLQAMVICQSQNAPADITKAVNERTARACERFDAALLQFDGGQPPRRPMTKAEEAAQAVERG